MKRYNIISSSLIWSDQYQEIPYYKDETDVASNWDWKINFKYYYVPIHYCLSRIIRNWDSRRRYNLPHQTLALLTHHIASPGNQVWKWMDTLNTFKYGTWGKMSGIDARMERMRGGVQSIIDRYLNMSRNKNANPFRRRKLY